VLGLVVLFVVLRAVFAGPSVSAPDQIDGVSRITTGQLADLMDNQIDDAGLGSHAVGGVYGSPTQPEFLFLAAEGSETADEDRQALEQAAAGLGTSGAITLDTSSITREERTGVTYSCAPIGGSGGLSGAACLWNDGDTLGMVFTFTDRGNPTEFASHVHDAVVG
jgi:hypothetical protein